MLEDPEDKFSSMSWPCGTTSSKPVFRIAVSLDDGYFGDGMDGRTLECEFLRWLDVEAWKRLKACATAETDTSEETLSMCGNVAEGECESMVV